MGGRVGEQANVLMVELARPLLREAAIDLSIPANAKAAPSGLVADDGLPGVEEADAEHRQDEPPSPVTREGLTILLRGAPRSPCAAARRLRRGTPVAGDGRPVECQNLHTIFCHALEIQTAERLLPS